MLSSGAEARSHAWRNLVAYLGETGAAERLFELLEQRGFLAGQADFFGDFGRTSEDVETYVLPAAIAAADWNRFLRYAAIALNLRGLAEDLAEPEILQALAQGDRRKLALDLAGRLAEPLRRAAAFAVIAQECRSDPALFRQMLESLGQSLEAPLPAPRDAIEVRDRTALLARMARLLGPDLTPRWSVWIDRTGLSPEPAAPVWRAVAESWLDRGEPEAPALWESLRQIRDPEALLAFLPEALGKLSPGNPADILTKLVSLFSTEDDRRRAGLSFLSHLAGRCPERTLALWEDWASIEEIPWTVGLIDTGGPLLALYRPEDLEALAGRLVDPALRAALRVVILEASKGRPDPMQTEAALDAVDQMPDGPEKLSWVLRYLAARPAELEDEVRGQLAAVAWYLHDNRYEAPPKDLRRYLDLIARFFEAELPFQMDSVFTSPASHPDVLHALVHSAKSPEVLEQVLKNASRYASLTALNESQAFRLRGEILMGAARRLCLLGADPGKAMEDAAERLLPREEDETRSALVQVLAGSQEDAAQIASGIRDGRSRLIAQLRAGAAERRDLDPSRLYAIVAQTGSLDTELSGLSSLLGRPDDPELLDRAPDDRVDLCLRLGWHALSFEAREFQDDWDPRAILSRLEPRLILASDEQLVAWTPAIVALAAQPNDRQAVAEVEEAAERIAGLDGVPWSMRREALERLLASLPALFHSLAGLDASRTGRRARAALSTLGHLPLRLPPGRARDELVAHWQEILPMVTAAAERIGPSRLPESPSGDTPDNLGNVIISSGIAPSEPEAEPLVRRLWSLSSDSLRRELAEGVHRSLRGGGRPRAEAILCWWLHGHLAPRLGELHEPGLARAREAALALSRAHTLGSDQGGAA